MLYIWCRISRRVSQVMGDMRRRKRFMLDVGPGSVSMAGFTVVSSRKHSRTGCITCKVRKKRCSEHKPVCNDCRRLGFSCVYLPRCVDRRVMLQCRSQVERELLGHKGGRRRPAALDETIEPPAMDDYVSLDQQRALTAPVLLELEPAGVHLYNYYRSHLAQIVSIAPMRQNYYLQVFLPMAHQHSGILYGIMAWSAHHLSISAENGEAEGSRDQKYLELANKYTLESLRRLREDQANGPNFLWSLAQLLILCAAEICQGDVNKWKILLKFGAELIEQHVGRDICKVFSHRSLTGTMPGLDSTTRYWLLANFIYHDIMCSQGTFFPTEQYRRALCRRDGENSVPSVLAVGEDPQSEKLHLDPLNGINRPILLYLGDINNLTRKMKLGPLPFNRDHPHFKTYMQEALSLEAGLHQLVPNTVDLKLYQECPEDHELCLQLFRLMQTAALVHLKTSCLKYSKYCMEIQYLWMRLSESLERVLGTKLEGSLCFPMFICGITCTDQQQRDLMEARFNDMMKRYKCYNFQRARTIVRKIWKYEYTDLPSRRSSGASSTSSGDDNMSFDLSIKDWYDIVDEMGWDISFA
ncbi:hypothetical protein HG536_0B05350 [Torulaspora globosa]|uniref:Zn(2)-C6 fungal-type domain-containing protein n=1 Tax=Torulaspora globosa TaxID=48254 RepID=A0A7G3ZDT4_9SACH|nr:uncharacterized protein HG536_0B05350 [Torulaspora globosa]QLL31670.1 hypothetical protein HG536_0B05350 [Torulaspora globosa]